MLWKFVNVMSPIVQLIMDSLRTVLQSRFQFLYNRVFLFSKYVPKPYLLKEAGNVMLEVWSPFPHPRTRVLTATKNGGKRKLRHSGSRGEPIGVGVTRRVRG